MTNIRNITDAEALITGFGAYPYDWQPIDMVLKNASASTSVVGEVFMVDPATVDSSFNYTQVIDPTAVLLPAGVYCVALEAKAAGLAMRCRFVGDVTAVITSTAVNSAVGTLLYPIATVNELTSVASTGVPSIARSKETSTGAKRVYFNGFGIGRSGGSGGTQLIAAQTAAGTPKTATTAGSILHASGVVTIPANFFTVGKILKISASGVISTLITTPGTTRFQVRLGPTSTISVFDSLAILNDSVVANVDAGWKLDILLTCLSVGSPTLATLAGIGTFASADIIGVPGTPPKANAIAVLPWAAAPAAGTGFDSTVANVLDLFHTQTAATGSITVQQYLVEALN